MFWVLAGEGGTICTFHTLLSHPLHGEPPPHPTGPVTGWRGPMAARSSGRSKLVQNKQACQTLLYPVELKMPSEKDFHPGSQTRPPPPQPLSVPLNDCRARELEKPFRAPAALGLVQLCWSRGSGSDHSPLCAPRGHPHCETAQRSFSPTPARGLLAVICISVDARVGPLL